MKDVRPTSGRVLQALFNILGDVSGISFLDLFAGTGRVGLEALNRGAESVIFVESVKPRAVEISNKLNKLKNKNNCTVLSLEVRRAVSWLLKRDKKFDVIFADPPYNAGWGGEFLKLNNLAELLSPNGILIFEHSAREEFLINNPEFEYLMPRRDYGESCLSILHHARTAGDECSDSSKILF